MGALHEPSRLISRKNTHARTHAHPHTRTHTHRDQIRTCALLVSPYERDASRRFASGPSSGTSSSALNFLHCAREKPLTRTKPSTLPTARATRRTHARIHANIRIHKTNKQMRMHTHTCQTQTRYIFIYILYIRATPPFLLLHMRMCNLWP